MVNKMKYKVLNLLFKNLKPFTRVKIIGEKQYGIKMERHNEPFRWGTEVIVVFYFGNYYRLYGWLES